MDLLESTPQWHADGTFKCCPALFYQLYTVLGVLNGHTIPLVYMLLKRKTRELYLRALNELKEINPCLQPSQITIDFEIACLLAFEEFFPKVSIKGKIIFRPHFNSFQRKLVSLLFFAGCFFYFAQANWCKVQDLGLKEVYGQQMKVRILIKSCVSLALIPPEDVIMGFDQVCSASESFPQIKCYLEYFEV